MLQTEAKDRHKQWVETDQRTASRFIVVVRFWSLELVKEE